MRKTNALLISFCLTLFLFTSCKDNTPTLTDTLQYVPATSTSVTSVNLDRLMQKADFDQVKNMEFYQEAVKEAKAENAGLAAIMMDPYTSGVDLKKNMYLSYEMSEEDLQNSTGALTFNLTDQATFEAALAKADIPKAESRTGFKWVEMNRNGAIAYTDNMGMLIFSTQRNNDLAAFAQKIIETTPENSISTNSKASEILSEDHDIVSWSSLDAFGKNPDIKFGTAMAGIPEEALTGNSLRSHADFLDGEVIAKSNFFLKKDLTRDIDLLFKDEVDTDFSPFVPGKNNLFAFAVALDVDGLNQILKERPQYKGMGDFALQEYGLSIDDLVATLQGDLLLSGYGERNAVNGIFATKIKDAAKMRTFLEIGEEFGLFNKEGDMYRVAAPGFDPTNGMIDPNGYVFIKDDILFITADKNLVDQIQDGGLSSVDRLSKDALNQLNSHIFGTYINGTSIDNLVKEFDMSSIQDILFSLDRKDSDSSLRFTEKGQNSLKTIFELVNQAYLKAKEEEGVEM